MNLIIPNCSQLGNTSISSCPLTTYDINQYDIGNTIGSKLYHYRKVNNLTQAKLANIIGCTESHVADIEKDKKVPGRELSEKLSKHFNLESKYFFDAYLEDTYNISEKLKKFQGDKNVKDICNSIGVKTNTWYSWVSGVNNVSRKVYLILKQKGII